MTPCSSASVVLINPVTPEATSRCPKFVFGRANGAKLLLVRAEPEGLGERGDLDGIAQRRGRAVRLDVIDRLRLHVGHRLRGGNDLRLPLHARRGVADLARAVVIDGCAFDDGADAIAIRHRIGEALQHHDAAAIAKDRALRGGVERPAMPIRGAHRPLLVLIARAPAGK